jgi:hypothetical protein
VEKKGWLASRCQRAWRVPSACVQAASGFFSSCRRGEAVSRSSTWTRASASPGSLKGTRSWAEHTSLDGQVGDGGRRTGRAKSSTWSFDFRARLASGVALACTDGAGRARCECWASTASLGPINPINTSNHHHHAGGCLCTIFGLSGDRRGCLWTDALLASTCTPLLFTPSRALVNR